MDGNIENILKIGVRGDKEKVFKVLNGLRHILKETQNDRRSKSVNILRDKNSVEQLSENNTENANLCNIVKNNSNILVDASIQNHDRTDFYNENNLMTSSSNNAKLKDIAETYQHETKNLDHENDDNNNSTIDTIENLQENDMEANNAVDKTNELEESSCIPTQMSTRRLSSSSTSVDDLNFGINELLLIVEEYEGLKEKYLKLETNVESKLKCTCHKQLSIDAELSLRKIEELQRENKR